MAHPQEPQPDECEDVRSSHDLSAGDSAGKVESAGEAGPPGESYLARQIDNYKIQELLGEGSFGRVYLARDTKLDRNVAIKFLKFSLLNRDHELFRREAQGLAALSKHSHIVQIYAWGEYEGHCYFVLEYLPLSLGRLLKERPQGLPLSQSIRIIAEAAEGAHFAHQQGVLHVDIKPDNILVEEGGGAKLADFGLMRFCQPGEAIVASQISGSPPYMAPEQVHNDPIDARTDVFALGVSLYHALSGKRPFEGNTPIEIMSAISRHKVVPLQERKPGIPDDLVRVVDKAIAHRPEKRFQSAGELAETLHAVEQGLRETVAASTIRGSVARRPGYRRVALGAVLGLFLLCLGAFWLWNGMQPAEASQYLVQGRDALEKDELEDAELLFSAALEENRDMALYGLGHTMLKQGRSAEASEVFQGIADPELRAEGVAAVAWRDEGEKAESKLAASQEVSSSSYVETLLAAVDLANQRPEQVVRRLEGMSPETIKFRWQYTEALRTLGQAYLDLKRYEEANRIFQELENTESPTASAIAEAYLALTKAHMDTARRAAIRAQVADVKKAIDALPPEDKERDTWRSRPLTFILLPAKCRNGRLARESGLVEVWPYFLLRTLSNDTELRTVNRDFIDEILLEQELSAQLSAGETRLAVHQFLGGRFIIECEFVSVNGKEFVNTILINTESTEQIFPDRVPLEPPVDPTAVSREVAQAIRAAVRKDFPLRGYLTKHGGQFKIDIGTNVGVEPGMQFKVGLADSKRILPERVLRVTNEIGPDSASVALESGVLENEPEGGWVVVESGAVSTPEEGMATASS